MRTDVSEYLERLPKWGGTLDTPLSLDTIERILALLDNPEHAVPVVHVAGTNGKGSVSAAIASMLGAAGKKVGLYTSPHLLELNERIVIDGLPLSTEILERGVEAVRAAVERSGTVPSFFEVMTAVAFWSFRELSLDYGVLEVGLGGRLDATNVVTQPLVTIVTTIAFDHEHILGDTLAKIAAEKAGIIKARVPVVVGALPAEALAVVKARALAVAAPCYVCGEEFRYSILAPREACFETTKRHLTFRHSLAGEHQAHNMSLAVQAGLLLGLNDEAIQRGLAQVFWPARLEEVQWKDRRVLIDAGHNPAGIATLVHYLSQIEGKVDCCFGAITTKNWREMIELLRPKTELWYVLEPQFHKAVSAGEIGGYLRLKGAQVAYCGVDSKECLQKVIETDRPLVLTGSIYLIGGMRSMVGATSAVLWNRCRRAQGNTSL